EIFAATWRIRGGTRVDVITPNEAEVEVAVGLLKFTVLKMLNASPRSSSLRRSVSGKTLCRAKSVWKKPGPVKMFRPAPYSPTFGVVNMAFPASLRYVTADPPFTSVPTEVGSPLNAAFVLTFG